MNGAQLVGYGIKDFGMGGASIALPLDASAAVNNLAGMAFVPQSFAMRVIVFNGQSTTNTPAIPPVGISAQTFNNNTTVSAPEGGANWAISPTSSHVHYWQAVPHANRHGRTHSRAKSC